MTRKPIPVALLTEAATMRRSSLYAWMMEHHDTFEGVVKEAVRPNWESLAATFADQGLRDADNKPPTEECTRQTWWKVRKAMAARKKTAAERAARQQMVAPTTLLPAQPTTRDQPADVQHNRPTPAFPFHPAPKIDKRKWGRKE